MLSDANGAPLATLSEGDAVTVTVPAYMQPDPTSETKTREVPEAVYTGTVLAVRGAGATTEYFVRYPMPGGRRETYDVWWPFANVNPSSATG